MNKKKLTKKHLKVLVFRTRLEELGCMGDELLLGYAMRLVPGYTISRFMTEVYQKSFTMEDLKHITLTEDERAAVIADADVEFAKWRLGL